MEPLEVPVAVQFHQDERALLAMLAATLMAPIMPELRVSQSVSPETVMEECAKIGVAFARIVLAKVDESLK